jgi:hypothetical protein
MVGFQKKKNLHWRGRIDSPACSNHGTSAEELDSIGVVGLVGTLLFDSSARNIIRMAMKVWNTGADPRGSSTELAPNLSDELAYLSFITSF